MEGGDADVHSKILENDERGSNTSCVRYFREKPDLEQGSGLVMCGSLYSVYCNYIAELRRRTLWNVMTPDFNP